MRSVVNYRLLALPLLLSTSLAACGGDDVSVEAISPGSECSDGGFRITVNDEPFVSCNGGDGGDGGVTAESVEKGADGNPCPGAALRLTFTVDGGTQEAWSCSDVDESVFNENNAPFLSILRAELDIMNAVQANEIECLREDDPGAAILTEAVQETFLQREPALMQCAAEFYNAMDLDQASHDMVACAAGLLENATSCIDTASETVDDLCGGSFASAIYGCAAERAGDINSCANPDSALAPSFVSSIGAAIHAVCGQYLPPLAP